MLQVRFKRGTAAQNDALTEAAGVLTIDNENFGIRIHDGVTAGGHALIIDDGVSSLQSQIDSLGIAEVDGLEAALAAKIAITELGVAGGVAELNPEAVVPTEQLPSYVEDIIEVVDLASLPTTGEVGKLYITADTNELYRWSGGQQQYYRLSAVVESTDDLSEGQVNLYFTEQRVRDSISAQGDLSYDPVTGILEYSSSVNSVAGQTGDVVVTKSDVGLSNVENFGVATVTEAQEAVVSDKFVTSELTRSLVEYMGFEESESGWGFAGTILPLLQLGNTLNVLASRPTSTKRHTLCYANGSIWLLGGQTDNAPAYSTNRLYRYDIDTDTWELKAPAPRACMEYSACVAGDTIYFAGGNSGQASSYYGYLMAYDTVNDVWADLPQLTQKANNYYRAPSVYKDGKVYSFGINSSTNDIGTEVWVFDVTTETWSDDSATLVGSLPERLSDAVSAGDKTYLASYSTGAVRFYVYDHATKEISGPINTDTSTYADEEAAFEYLDGKLILHSNNYTSNYGFIVEYEIETDSWNEVLNNNDYSLIALDIQHDIALVGSDLYVARGGSTTSSTVVFNDFYKIS